MYCPSLFSPFFCFEAGCSESSSSSKRHPHDQTSAPNLEQRKHMSSEKRAPGCLGIVMGLHRYTGPTLCFREYFISDSK